MSSSATSEPGFSFGDYSAALRAFRDADYAVSGFDSYLRDPQPKHLILRHDLDNSLEQALRVAHLDADAGCTATFFVRVHARGYNLLDLPSLRALATIELLGHDIELHLEGGFAEVLGGDNISWADRQRAVFEAAVGRELRGFSVHEPARMGGIDFANLLLDRWGDSVEYHAYEPRFMMPSMKYVSDSSGRWREGHFATWVNQTPLLHVLTHPIWWFEQIPAENY